ncbi:hypothetical protein RRG08_066695 [Elysia crispata]|nr:hypothetical protein RRG08_066695 [Elysia crispata]
MSSTGVFTLSFSYALSGNAKLEVRALDVRGRDNLAWSSTYESARKWVEVKVTPVNSWGLTKIIFKVLGSSPSTDTPVYVGLTDISITVPDEDNSKDDIGITRGVDGTGRVNGDDVDKNQGDDRDDTISNHSGDDHEDKKDSFEQYGVILLVLVLIIAVVVLIVVVVWKKDRMLPLLRVAPASSLVV